MFDLRACRSCLSTRGKMEKMTDLTKKTYTSVTGLEITSEDGLPNYFCIICHSYLKKLLAFRRRSRRAHFVLKEILAVEKHVTLNNIMLVNRKRTNLISPYGRNTSKNIAYYTMETIEQDIDTIIESMGKYQTDGDDVVVTKQNLDTGTTILHIDIKPEEEISVPVEEIVTEDTEMKVTEVEEELTEDVVEDLPMDIESIPSPPPTSPKPEVKDEKEVKVRKVMSRLPTKKVRINCSILAQCKIRMLSHEEQVRAFKKRLQHPWFRDAMIKCALCVKVFDDVDVLLNHIDSHNKDVHLPYMCRICKVKFPTEEKLRIHKSVAHLYEYKCKKCSAEPVYVLNEIIQHHKRTHSRVEYDREYRMTSITKNFELKLRTEEETKLMPFHPAAKYRCTGCDMRFIHMTMLHVHMKRHRVPATKKIYKCDHCQVHYKFLGTLRFHMQAMHMYTFHCKACPTVAYNLIEAEYHLHDHLQARFLCEFCHKRYKVESTLKKHWKAVHYTKTHHSHCNLCGESFLGEKELYVHQMDMHKLISIQNPFESVKEYFCGDCNFQFASLKAFHTHALRHEHEEVVNTIQYACAPCKVMFESAQAYEKHIHTECKSTKDKYRCAYCPAVLDTARVYFSHHKREHREHPYRPVNLKLCEQCGQSVSDLVGHRRRHSARAPGACACALCYPARAFPSARRYASHVVRTHTRLPYVCALCDVAFKWCSECRDHILKTHAPVLPYKCDICNKSFAHEDFLKEHAMYVHRQKIEVPRAEYKTTFTLFVYPHMKLNVSVLGRAFLSQIEIEMWDYLHEKKEVLGDFSDYVILEEPKVGGKRCKAKRNKVSKTEVKVTEVVECVENLDIVEQDGEQFVNIGGVLYKVLLG